MRKSYAIITILIFMLIAAVHICAYTEDLSISEQMFYSALESGDTDIQYLIPGLIYAKTRVENSGENEAPVTMVSALYASGRLEDIVLTTETVDPYSSEVLSGRQRCFDLSDITEEELAGYTAKIIIISNIDTVQPLTYNVKEISGEKPQPTQPPDWERLWIDDMDDDTAMYSKTSNMNFYSEKVKIYDGSQEGVMHASKMAKRGGEDNIEGHVIYRLDKSPVKQIYIDTYFYDQRGYAGTIYAATGQERLDAILALEGLRIYQSEDNVEYTEIEDVRTLSAVSQWPGQASHYVRYIIDSVDPLSSYIKISIPGNGDGTTVIWSTRIDRVIFKYGAGAMEDDYGWVNQNLYPQNKISVVTPQYAGISDSNNLKIVVCAPGFTELTARTWERGGTYGASAVIDTIGLDSRGVGSFVLPAGRLPYGPITVNISGYNDNMIFDECNLQLYNKAGVSWNEGLAKAGMPDVVYDLGLVEVFSDDFTAMPTISWNPNSGRKYSSHKPGWGDFSGLAFTNRWDEDKSSVEKDPFSQIDTYLRIRANQNQNSTGLISSVHQDRKGFAVKAPAYFECRFIAQNAKGTWPAFWLLTTPHYSVWKDIDDHNRSLGNDENHPSYIKIPMDELDVIEAYGFDPSQIEYNDFKNRYSIARHNWKYTPEVHQHDRVYMTEIGGGGIWHTNFHTYGCLVTETETIYYCDNVPVWSEATTEASKKDYIYFLINLAVGGSSGWPYDLSRYNGISDMYVDWVRVYGLPQNVMK